MGATGYDVLNWIAFSLVCLWRIGAVHVADGQIILDSFFNVSPVHQEVYHGSVGAEDSEHSHNDRAMGESDGEPGTDSAAPRHPVQISRD